MRKVNIEGWQTVRIIALARAFSILGDELAIFALLLREKHNGGGAIPIALIFTAGTLPLILLAPWAGTIADRIPIRRLAPFANIAQAVPAGLLAFNTPLPVSLLLICLIGVGQAFTAPAWAATLPEIVNREALPRALSLMQAFYSIAGLLGPGVAGIMVSKLGYVTPMIANAASFVVLALVPAFVVLPKRGRHVGPRIRGDVWVGLQIVRRDPVVRALTILFFSLNLAAGIFSVAELFFALDVLHASTFIYGLTASIFAGGMLGAALVNKRRDVSAARLPANIIAGCLVASLGIFLTGLSWHWAVLLPTAALGGIGVSTLNSYGQALLLQRAPEASRARLMSAVQAVSSIGQITSFAIAGILVSLIEPRFAILASGAACLLVLGVLSKTVLGSASQNQINGAAVPGPITDLPINESE